MRRRATASAPLLVAHRAGNRESLLLEAALAGADLVEADVRYHRGRIEVRHLKSMGPLPLLWDRWLLAPGWTSRFLLHELLRVTPPGCELMLDIKGGHPDYPAQVLDAVQRELAGREVTVCSQYWQLLLPFHEQPNVRVVHSIGSARMLRDVLPHLERHRSDAVSIHKKLLTSASVTDLLQRVELIMTWPVNDAIELERLRRLGVNGFIIDDLRLLRSLACRRPIPAGIG